jgi:hypothetical protein
VNDRHGWSCEDEEIRVNRLGFVAHPEISVVFREIQVAGWAVDQTFDQALRHHEELEVAKARDLARKIRERVPDYRHPSRDFSLERLLTEPMADKHTSALIVLGQGMLPQLHECIPAMQLREKISGYSRAELEAAFIVTDSGLLQDARFQSCACISLGGPETNAFTRAKEHELQLDPASSDGVFLQHNIDRGDRRVLLWGKGREETIEAVERFISTGLLVRYLKLVWGREI